MERRAPSHGRELSADCAHELLNGKISYPAPGFYDGYGDGVNTDLSLFISERMKADWLANRKLLIKVWRSGELFPHEYFAWRLWNCVEHNGEPFPWAERVFGGSSSP
jgi:hypothetical protein